jgi:Domain of unknown function DUF29
MSQPIQQLTLASPLYETDYYAWTQTQAQLLRSGQLHKIDVGHIAEEIESLGKQQQQELRNRLGILLGHLLKWQFQPTHRSKSWRITIRGQRREIRLLLEDNPSLQPYLVEALDRGYAQGLDLALQETNLEESDFPLTCPYGFEQALDDEFFPD